MTRRQNVGKLERISSAGLAGLLVLGGLKQRGLKRLLSLSTAGFLAYRAGSGYCPAYERLALDSTSSASHPRSAQDTVTILADPERTYDFVRDLSARDDIFTRFHLLPSAEEEGQVLWRLDLPLQRSYSVPLRLVEDRTNRSITLEPVKDDSPILRIHFKFTEGRNEGETRVDLIADYKIPGGYMGNQVASLLEPAVRTMLRSNLLRLKSKLEAGEIPSIEGQVSGRQQRSYR